MGRKRSDPNSLLIHRIRVRVDDKAFKRLEALHAKSNCRSMAELLRRILSNEKIIMLYRDVSLKEPIQELAGIRLELKAIGNNINQVTRHFNTADTDRKKLYYALEVGEQYAKVTEKVNTLMEMVDTLGRKWLQR